MLPIMIPDRSHTLVSSMQVDVAMEQLGDPAISHNAEIDAPAKEPEHVDVPDVPMVPANEHAISPVITTAWNNTIFGPLCVLMWIALYSFHLYSSTEVWAEVSSLWYLKRCE